MPDTALRSTERQYVRLLSAAVGTQLVRLNFYSLPGIARSQEAQVHIGRFYGELRELWETPPDALIVTGTTPSAPELCDEPFWTEMARLIDWSMNCKIPCIWSCLAAHAAVFQIDGIKRNRLAQKLSGVFDCQFMCAPRGVLNGMPAYWKVPHSRYYGLCDATLLEHGYDILSQSHSVGADLFTKTWGAPHLFVQGHPEYGPSTLISEYRRDVASFMSHYRDDYPAIPANVFTETQEHRLLEIAANLMSQRSDSSLRQFHKLLDEVAATHPWHAAASTLYSNWLALLSRRSSWRALSLGPGEEARMELVS